MISTNQTVLAYYIKVNFDGKSSALLTLNVLERNHFLFKFINGDYPEIRIEHKKYWTSKEEFIQELRELQNAIT